MVPSASIPAVRQNRSKLTETASQALSTAPIPVGGKAVNGVIAFFMALLSFRGISTPSLPAQGEQRRSFYFNIPRGNSKSEVAKPVTVLRSITGAIALALGASFQLADHYRLYRKLRLIPGPEGHFHRGRRRRDVGRQVFCGGKAILKAQGERVERDHLKHIQPRRPRHDQGATHRKLRIALASSRQIYSGPTSVSVNRFSRA